MDSRVFDKKNVILLKITDNDLLSFMVDTDIDDKGNYDWRLSVLANEIIGAIPEYVFANYKGESVTYTEMVDSLREAAKSIYRIPEYVLMKKYCIDNDPDAEMELKKLGFNQRGEFGEILLHLLLRDFKNTIPLISKVYFKDSAGVPAHGFDAVHITPDDGILWLGESKFYKDAKSGLKALLDDLTNHFKKDYLNEQFSIIKKNASNNSIPERDYWIDRLSSASKLSDKLNMINIPMLCIYNDDIYERYDDFSDEQAVSYHKSSVKELKNFFDTNNNHPLKKRLNIILFMFAIKDKKSLIMALHEKLWHLQNI